MEGTIKLIHELYVANPLAETTIMHDEPQILISYCGPIRVDSATSEEIRKG